MTLILTAINRTCVIQVSDRLTTMWNGGQFLGEYDQLANKTVVYIASDGPLAISYAGAAYVGSRPTDEWIAQKLAGRQFKMRDEKRLALIGFMRLPERSISQVCRLLETAITSEPSFNGTRIELAIGGWRIKRRRIFPIALGIEWANNSISRVGNMRLPDRKNRSFVISAGQVPDQTEGMRAAVAHPDPCSLRFNPEVRSQFLADRIRHSSVSNQSIGADTMAIEIGFCPPDGTQKVVIRYRPDTTRFGQIGAGDSALWFPAAFWPWVVTPAGYKAPGISTGDGISLNLCGWTFEFKAPSHTPLPGNVTGESSLVRKRRPGRQF